MRVHEILEDRIYGDTPPRTKPMDLEQAISMIKLHCKDALKDERINRRIFRGFKTKMDAGYFDPSLATRPRISRNTNNFITLIMDNSLAWTDFPKRSKSMICSTAQGKAAGYGEVYMVLPYDGVKIGIAPTYDIWDAFDKVTGYDVPHINESLETACQSTLHEGLNQIDYSIMVRQLTQVGKIICEETAKVSKAFKGMYLEDEFGAVTTVKWNKPDYNWQVIKDLTDSGTNPNILQRLEEDLSPQINGFRLHQAGSLGLTVEESVIHSKEVWLEGPAILVHRNHWESALKFNEIEI